jgi:hypothetical protein
MTSSPTQRRPRRAALLAVPLLAAGAWGWSATRDRASNFVAAPLARELRDLAVDCLASGTVRPGLAELADDKLDALIEIVGRLIAAYAHADFDSFCSLRAGDLAAASRRRAADVAELRTIGEELGISPAEMPDDWTAALDVFWRAYYAVPTVARFLPEGTRVEWNVEGLGPRALEEWEQSFDVLRDRLPGTRIQHELAIPHRRTLEQVARDAGPLSWLDLELAFETTEGRSARVVARFVWDGALREWFLQKAASIYPKDDRSQRRLIL